jgi:hypothetical protein
VTAPFSSSRLSEAPLIVVDGVTVWRPEDQEDPLIKIEVGGSVHVRKASEWHALAVASFALSETATNGRPFGAALATAVLQSDEYHRLDPEARAECDELLERWKGWLKHG